MALVKGTNSYITVPEADSYFRDNLRFESWSALSSTVKSRALVTASSQINLFVINAYKFTIDVTEIPANLANGTAELALDMALDESVITQANTGSNIKTLKAGTAEIEFFNPTFRSTSSTRFPQHVMDLLGDCLASTSSAIGVGIPFASGTDEESSFIDRNQFGFTEGI